MQNIVNLILVMLLIVAIILFYKKSEHFTPDEMKKYPESLYINCDRSTNMLKKLRKMNKARCDPKNKRKTDRDTINNKRLCYDDIGKEIVTNLDAESNCIMSKLINKKFKVPEENLKPDEGPEFINSFFIPAFDTKKTDKYAGIIINQPIGSSHTYPATSSYDDVSRIASDPLFLAQLTKK